MSEVPVKFIASESGFDEPTLDSQGVIIPQKSKRTGSNSTSCKML